MRYDALIFDIGGVLLNWDPEAILNKFYDKDISKKLSDLTLTKRWAEYDRGLEDRENLYRYFIKIEPDYPDEIRFLIFEIFKYMEVLDETIEILYILKKKGKKLYLLSNFTRIGFEYVYKKHDFFNMFDGKVISCYINLIKPEKEIYEHIHRKYSLNLDKTIFIDDNDTNVKAALDYGIKSIKFTKADKLKEDLEL